MRMGIKAGCYCGATHNTEFPLSYSFCSHNSLPGRAYNPEKDTNRNKMGRYLFNPQLFQD